jgi:hypothetical protein
MEREELVRVLRVKLREAQEDARELPETIHPGNYPAANARGKVYAYRTILELLEADG